MRFLTTLLVSLALFLTPLAIEGAPIQNPKGSRKGKGIDHEAKFSVPEVPSKPRLFSHQRHDHHRVDNNTIDNPLPLSLQNAQISDSSNTSTTTSSVSKSKSKSIAEDAQEISLPNLEPVPHINGPLKHSLTLDSKDSSTHDHHSNIHNIETTTITEASDNNKKKNKKNKKKNKNRKNTIEAERDIPPNMNKPLAIMPKVHNQNENENENKNGDDDNIIQSKVNTDIHSNSNNSNVATNKNKKNTKKRVNLDVDASSSSSSSSKDSRILHAKQPHSLSDDDNHESIRGARGSNSDPIDDHPELQLATNNNNSDTSNIGKQTASKSRHSQLPESQVSKSSFSSLEGEEQESNLSSRSRHQQQGSRKENHDEIDDIQEPNTFLNELPQNRKRKNVGDFEAGEGEMDLSSVGNREHEARDYDPSPKNSKRHSSKINKRNSVHEPLEAENEEPAEPRRADVNKKKKKSSSSQQQQQEIDDGALHGVQAHSSKKKHRKNDGVHEDEQQDEQQEKQDLEMLKQPPRKRRQQKEQQQVQQQQQEQEEAHKKLIHQEKDDDGTSLGGVQDRSDRDRKKAHRIDKEASEDFDEAANRQKPSGQLDTDLIADDAVNLFSDVHQQKSMDKKTLTDPKTNVQNNITDPLNRFSDKFAQLANATRENPKKSIDDEPGHLLGDKLSRTKPLADTAAEKAHDLQPVAKPPINLEGSRDMNSSSKALPIDSLQSHLSNHPSLTRSSNGGKKADRDMDLSGSVDRDREQDKSIDSDNYPTSRKNETLWKGDSTMNKSGHDSEKTRETQKQPPVHVEDVKKQNSSSSQQQQKTEKEIEKDMEQIDDGALHGVHAHSSKKKHRDQDQDEQQEEQDLEILKQPPRKRRQQKTQQQEQEEAHTTIEKDDDGTSLGGVQDRSDRDRQKAHHIDKEASEDFDEAANKQKASGQLDIELDTDLIADDAGSPHFDDVESDNKDSINLHNKLNVSSGEKRTDPQNDDDSAIQSLSAHSSKNTPHSRDERDDSEFLGKPASQGELNAQDTKKEVGGESQVVEPKNSAFKNDELSKNPAPVTEKPDLKLDEKLEGGFQQPLQPHQTPEAVKSPLDGNQNQLTDVKSDEVSNGEIPKFTSPTDNSNAKLDLDANPPPPAGGGAVAVDPQDEIEKAAASSENAAGVLGSDVGENSSPDRMDAESNANIAHQDDGDGAAAAAAAGGAADAASNWHRVTDVKSKGPSTVVVVMCMLGFCAFVSYKAKKMIDASEDDETFGKKESKSMPSVSGSQMPLVVVDNLATDTEGYDSDITPLRDRFENKPEPAAKGMSLGPKIPQAVLSRAKTPDKDV